MKKTLLFLFLIFLSLTVFAADVNKLELVNTTESSDPVNSYENFNIITQLSVDSNTALLDFNSLNGTWGAGINPNGTVVYGFKFVPRSTGQLYFIDLNVNEFSGGCTDLNGTIYDNNSINYIGIDVPKDSISGTVDAVKNADIGSVDQCRFDFLNENLYLTQDQNYWLVTMFNAAVQLTADVGNPTIDSYIAVKFVSDGYWSTCSGTIPTCLNDARISVFNYGGVSTEFVTDASVYMTFGANPRTTMSYDVDSNGYLYSKTISETGTFDYNIFAVRNAGEGTDTVLSDLTVIVNHQKFLTVTDKTNVSHSINLNNVGLEPTNEANLIEFQVDSNNTSSMDVNYIVNNSLNDGKQYFVYTATQAQYDANVWVFNDSLTYGISATFDDPIQKIWDGAKYKHNFVDTLLANETKYYRLTYRSPALYYETITASSDWFKQLLPDTVDINAKTHDVYTVSNFSNIRNELIESIPQLLSTENVAFEIQFTAFTESGTVTFQAGLTNEAGTSDSTNNVTITTAPHRYSVDVNSLEDKQRLLLKTAETSSATLYVTDYALVERGHFTKRLRVTKENNEPLDVLVVSIGGAPASRQYIREGRINEVHSTAYDREGDLNKLRLEVFLDTADDTNRVVFKEIELTGVAETIFDFSELIPPIIDLNGSYAHPVPPRDIKVTLTLYDVNNLAVEEQSEWFKFIQWPYFPDDVEFFITPIGKKVAEFPEGIFHLITKDPSTILGIKLRIFDEDSSLTSPDKTKIFYKDIDFSCVGVDCGFEWELDDWKYEDANNYTIAGTVLVNTENEDINNPYLHKEIIILVSFLEFETLRFFEIFERTDHTYTNTEEIGLVLQSRTSDYSNMKKNLRVSASFQNCDSNVAADANCLSMNTAYLPEKFLYDPSTGYNYWFWKQIYVDDDGTLFDDGNHYRVIGSITDVELKHESGKTPVLAPKCQSYDLDIFTLNMLGLLNHFIIDPCTVQTSALVTITDNPSEEQYLNINTGRTTTAPTYECLACVAPDTNNVYSKATEAPLFCVSLYTLGENPVDLFTLQILNENSDTSFDDEDELQYIEERIPYDLVAFNDIQLMKKALEKEGNTIDTLAEFLAEGFNYLFVGTVNPLLNETELLTNTGIIPNAGYDCNLNKVFSPTNISGAFFFRVDGLKVINKHDYRGNENILQSDAKYLRRVANQEGVTVNVPQTKLTVYASDMLKVIEKEIDSPLVIDIDPAIQAKINEQNLDENQSAKYDVIPTQLRFDIVSDLIYNNELSTIRRFLTIFILHDVTPIFGYQDLVDIFNDLILDPVGTVYGLLFANILVLLIVLPLAFSVAVIFYIWYRRNG